MSHLLEFVFIFAFASERRCRTFGFAPHSVPVFLGMQPPLHFSFPPSGGSPQLPQLAAGRRPQLGRGELQQQSLEPRGQTLPSAQHRAVLREVHPPSDLWTHLAGFTAESGRLGFRRGDCGFHLHGL